MYKSAPSDWAWEVGTELGHRNGNSCVITNVNTNPALDCNVAEVLSASESSVNQVEAGGLDESAESGLYDRSIELSIGVDFFSGESNGERQKHQLLLTLWRREWMVLRRPMATMIQGGWVAFNTTDVAA